jgi:ubiquinone/menaquinone biosynthesis C-methylase UbiE|tara:strand:+ start:1510 stop:2151 length:642 start_codon:yes stop_codon:yes gene_type:complete
MNKPNKIYWNKYYNSRDNNNKPSNFALFIAKKFIKKQTFLLDVGSGDGRDSFHHRKIANHVFGVDLSNVAIEKNKLKAKRLGLKNITFKNLSSNNLIKVSNRKINFIYARFFLHAINESNENKFLRSIIENFNKKTIIALEFRTTKDVLMKKGKKISEYERLTNHYRRFIDVEKFEQKLLKMNFKIIYKKLGINLSKSPNDNPHLCRIVFRRK